MTIQPPLSSLLSTFLLKPISNLHSTFAIQLRLASSKKGGSSARYLARQKNDFYVKSRQQGSVRFGSRNTSDKFGDDVGSAALGLGGVEGNGGYISRSAFKLAQLDDRYHFLKPDRVVVDLGAAPGGWTQVITQRLGQRRASQSQDEDHRDGTSQGKDRESIQQRTAKVFALDILPMHPVEGATALQGNFLDPNVQQKLRQLVMQDAQGLDVREDTALTPAEGDSGTTKQRQRGFVDVVVSDMMANTTGNSIADTEASLELCRAALAFALATLKVDRQVVTRRDGGKRTTPPHLSSVLVLKYFMSSEADIFRKEELEKYFTFVKAEKMEASRKESREQFWICRGFRGAPSFVEQTDATQ